MDKSNISSGRDADRYFQQERERIKKEERHNAVLEEGAKASSKSIEILQQQLSELQEQTKTLSEGYDVAMKELAQAKKSGRIDRIIAIISVVIAIASLIKSFI